MGENKVFRLQRGGTALLNRGRERRSGEVLSAVSSRMVIQFSEPLWAEVEVGQRIELHYWQNRNTLLIYQAEVQQMGAHRRQIGVSILEEREERRRHRRFEIPVAVSATVVQAADPRLVGREFVSETQNISLGGLLLEIPLKLGVGDKLKVELRLGPNERLSAPAWVVRSRTIKKKEYIGTVIVKTSQALAMEFQLEDEDRRRLFRFLLSAGAGEPVSSAAPEEATALAQED